MKVTIRGKVWDLQFTRLRGYLGMCDPPSMPGKRILIHKSLKGEILMDTVIHELMHAGHWDLTEEAVDECARDIARVLTRMGYTMTDEKRGPREA